MQQNNSALRKANERPPFVQGENHGFTLTRFTVC